MTYNLPDSPAWRQGCQAGYMFICKLKIYFYSTFLVNRL